MSKLLVVDTGGNGIRTCVVVDRLPIRSTLKESGKSKTLESWFDFISDQMPKIYLENDFDAIVYSAAGRIKDDDQMIDWPNGHELDGIYIATETTKYFNLPSRVYNDARTATKGMYFMTQEPNFAGITISSGIGGRFCLNGQILDNNTEVFGHMLWDPNSRKKCGCGVYGHYEAHFSGDAIIQEINEEMSYRGTSVPTEVHPCRYLDLSFDSNLSWARHIYKKWANGFGALMANLISFYPIEALVYKGTFGINAIPRTEEWIRESMRNYLMPGLLDRETNLRFVRSPGSKNEEAFVGAAICYEESLCI